MTQMIPVLYVPHERRMEKIALPPEYHTHSHFLIVGNWIRIKLGVFVIRHVEWNFVDREIQITASRPSASLDATFPENPFEAVKEALRKAEIGIGNIYWSEEELIAKVVDVMTKEGIEFRGKRGPG